MSVKIYLITNKAVEPNMYYVGETKLSIEERFLQHVRMGRRENNCLLHEAILEYGKRNFTIELLEIVSDDERKEKETYFIKKYKSHFRDGSGYNMKYETNQGRQKEYHGADKSLVEKNLSEGNAWNKGVCFSEKSKQKMKTTKQYRHSIGLYKNYGHLHTEETKKLLSDMAKSRNPPSEETRNKISLSSAGRIWIHNILLCKRMFVNKDHIITDGWNKGKGTCWVNNGEKSISVDIWEKEKYINEYGYVEGRLGNVI